MVQHIIKYKNSFLEFYQRHEVLVSIAIFILGFLFDVVTLGRIDNLANIIQQALYLLALGTLLICEIRISIGRMSLSPKGQRFWQYHELVVHFLFGSLLSANTLYFYTSASALTSFIFILLLAFLMLANEFPKFQKFGLIARVTLFSICLLSFFAFLYPILIGHVGAVPFWLGMISSGAVMFFVLKNNFENASEYIRKNVFYPTAIIHILFVLGYYTSVMPPVPVAVKKIGVYHEVIKENGNYIGTHERSWMDKLNKWTQTISTRPGEKIVVILSIFSPANFEDQVYLKWYYDHPNRGWNLEDTIKLSILGGRDEGFRGFASKAHYMPGLWRVEVETSDGREVGRLKIRIESDSNLEPREFYKDIF